jgi:hypothetical protein
MNFLVKNYYDQKDTCKINTIIIIIVVVVFMLIVCY